MSLREAEHILEDKIDRFRVFYDGAQITPAKTVLNKTYIWGTDSLGRDLFIRVVYGARVSPAGGRGGRPGQPDRGRTLRRHCRLLRRRCGQHHDADCGHHQLHPHDALCHSHHGGAGLRPALNHSGHGPDLLVGMVRIVRSQVLTMREQEFVSAAVLLGVPTRKILVRHLIPNAMGPIMVALTMQIPSAMFTEAFLSFIGLGVSKPQASWGALANAALPSLYTSPYQLFYPALIMSITILALNLFSDGLRDSLDPRLRK